MEELLPDPAHQAKTTAYIYQQAELGHFDHAHDVAVLQYLWQNAWRSTRNPERAAAGTVMQGKAAIPKICAATMLSRPSVKRAMHRLRDAGWIETEQGVFETGWKTTMNIFVRMDMSSHRERERTRVMMAEVAGILDGQEGSDRTYVEGSVGTPGGV